MRRETTIISFFCTYIGKERSICWFPFVLYPWLRWRKVLDYHGRFNLCCHQLYCVIQTTPNNYNDILLWYHEQMSFTFVGKRNVSSSSRIVHLLCPACIQFIARFVPFTASSSFSDQVIDLGRTSLFLRWLLLNYMFVWTELTIRLKIPSHICCKNNISFSDFHLYIYLESSTVGQLVI
jgi:hypothetical protein